MLIQEYRQHWAVDFLAIKTVISAVLRHKSVTIEHIGSTAVPGLAAKPIIDIDLVIRHPEEFAPIKSKLEALGYYHNGDQGIPDREVFKRRAADLKHPVLDVIPHHLYVCPFDSEELQRHLLFRDYLIKNPAARRQYADLKFEIAKIAGQDRKLYAKLKETRAREFILAGLEQAKKGRPPE